MIHRMWKGGEGMSADESEEKVSPDEKLCTKRHPRIWASEKMMDLPLDTEGCGRPLQNAEKRD